MYTRKETASVKLVNSLIYTDADRNSWRRFQLGPAKILSAVDGEEAVLLEDPPHDQTFSTPSKNGRYRHCVRVQQYRQDGALDMFRLTGTAAESTG